MASVSRSAHRNAWRMRIARAEQLVKQCPICGSTMKPAWYSRKTHKCPECKLSVRVTWLKEV